MKKNHSILLLILVFILFPFALLSQNKVDSAYVVFQNVIQNKNTVPLTIAKANYNYAMYLEENGKINKAKIHLLRALALSKEISNDSLLAKTNNYLGGIYWELGDCNTSTRYYEQALENAIKIKDFFTVSVIKMNLSGNYSTSGNSKKAIKYAIDALKYKEQNNLMKGICYDYVTVAEIFYDIGNMNKWKEYIKKAYVTKSIKNTSNVSSLVMIYNNLGRISEYEKNYDTALAYYDTILQISKPKKYAQGIGIALLNSALVLQSQNKFKKAYELAEQSEKHFGNVPYFIMATTNTKAELLKQMKQYNKALNLLSVNIKNKNMPLYPALKQACLKLLYEINFKLKNYNSAYSWNDSLINYVEKRNEIENKKVVKDIETKYQTEKKEQQIQLLSAENKLKTNRIQLSIGGIFILILTLIIIVFVMQIRRRKDKEKQEKLKQQLFRSQMNPHFLFNALSSIQSYMIKNKTQEASDYLGHFATLTRHILEHSSLEKVPFSEVISRIISYIELEKMRLNKGFSYHIIYDDNIDTEAILVPPMMLQPFIENTFKHAFKNIKYTAYLEIEFTEHNDFIEVKITDNGIGLLPKEKRNHKSMSIKIFEQRAKLLSKKTKQRVELKMIDRKTINTNESGVIVKFTLPILNK